MDCRRGRSGLSARKSKISKYILADILVVCVRDKSGKSAPAIEFPLESFSLNVLGIDLLLRRDVTKWDAPVAFASQKKADKLENLIATTIIYV